MAESRNDLQKCIIKELGLFLKAEGFVRHGLRFERVQGELVLYFEVRSWPGFGPHSYKFSVDVALTAPAIVQIAPEFFFSGVDIATAPLRMRIGFLLDDPHDAWWQVDSRIQCECQVSEVIDLIKRRCLARFGSMHTTQDLATVLRQDPLGNHWPRHIEDWFVDLLEGKSVAGMPPLPSI